MTPGGFRIAFSRFFDPSAPFGTPDACQYLQRAEGSFSSGIGVLDLLSVERGCKSSNPTSIPRGGISRIGAGSGGRHSCINEDANEPLPGRSHRDCGILHFPGEDSMKDSLDLTILGV